MEASIGLDCGDGIELKMKPIPAGEFMMGSKWKGEQPVHKVVIAQPFYAGIYPVTLDQYEVVMRRTPSPYLELGCPVDTVSWYDATEFCERLSSMVGRWICLPSEAQWEYACCAGVSDCYGLYYSEDHLGLYAWHRDNSRGSPVVGKKEPNAFGLYDMQGNVWEWCQDYWHESYADAPTDGGAWMGGDGSYRVCRGGSCLEVPWNCRSAARKKMAAGDTEWGVGFRVISSLDD